MLPDILLELQKIAKKDYNLRLPFDLLYIHNVYYKD